MHQTIAQASVLYGHVQRTTLGMFADHRGPTVGAGWGMDLNGITTSSAPALPSISPSYIPPGNNAQLPSNPSNQTPLEISSGFGVRRLYTKEQWEAQKSAIYRLYNHENKSYNQVVEILNAEQGFFPTYYLRFLFCGIDCNLKPFIRSNISARRRQFYRKINEWGFEKNFKESEMRAIAQNYAHEGYGSPIEIKGRTIDTEKIRRWQKRQWRMKSVASLSEKHPDIVVKAYNLDITNKHEPPLPESEKSGILTSDSTLISQRSDDKSSKDFELWTAVDVPGSPLLSRLFEALEIECLGTIPSISIGSPIVDSVQAYIADAKIGYASNREHIEYDIANKSEIEESYLPDCFSVALCTGDLPWSRQEWDMLSESYDQWAFSQWDFTQGQPSTRDRKFGPLKPLSPFPVAPSTVSNGSTASGLSVPLSRWKEIEMQEGFHKSRFKKSKKLFGADDPRLIETMICLAELYGKQSKYPQAEQMLRAVARSTQRKHGFKHRRTLSAYLSVTDILNSQGKYQQAAKIHPIIHATILSLNTEDELVLESTITKANIHFGLNQHVEAEKLNRQILQIRLNTLGPRHMETLQIMQCLARLLKNSNKLAESEQLYCTIIQLQHEIAGADEEIICRSQAELARILRCQGRYQESKALALNIAARSQASLGPEHRETLGCYFQIARCLGKLGQHDESLNMLQTNLERQIRRFGESNLDTVDTMYSLAHMLTKRGRLREAMSRYETCFKVYVENFGLDSSVALRICNKLGRCYKKLGRYDDALELYRKTLDQLRNASPENDQGTTKICGWIAKLENRLAAKWEDIYEEQASWSLDETLCDACYSIDEDDVGDSAGDEACPNTE